MSTDDDRPPLDERLTTKRAMETGIPESVAAFPDQMPEPVDLALDRLDADAFPNAHRDVGKQGQPEGGPWLIPVTDLIAAGLTVYAPAKVEAEPKATDSTEADLWAALADALRRAEVAEAVAAEREHTIAALNVAVRALEAGPVRTPPTEPMSVPSAQPTPARRHWWNRGS